MPQKICITYHRGDSVKSLRGYAAANRLRQVRKKRRPDGRIQRLSHPRSMRRARRSRSKPIRRAAAWAAGVFGTFCGQKVQRTIKGIPLCPAKRMQYVSSNLMSIPSPKAGTISRSWGSKTPAFFHTHRLESSGFFSWITRKLSATSRNVSTSTGEKA